MPPQDAQPQLLVFTQGCLMALFLAPLSPRALNSKEILVFALVSCSAGIWEQYHVQVLSCVWPVTAELSMGQGRLAATGAEGR